MLSAEVTLHNKGKVDLDFTAIGVSEEKDLTPGEISVQPANVMSVMMIFELACDFVILVNCYVFTNY